MTTPRFRGLLAVAAVLALSLTACSTGPADGGKEPAASAAPTADAGAFPVTIKHKFGETTITKQPQRVATVSWVNADVSIALGVVPVGMAKDDWGGNKHGSTPWKDAALTKLGAGYGTARYPAQYSETDGINFTAIAKLDPDIILAAYSGLSADDYKKLSGIAPVIAYPKVAYGTPWQESTRMIGKALGRSAEAGKLVTDTEQLIKDRAAAYPQLAGKTFIYGNLESDRGDGINLYTAEVTGRAS